MPIRFQGFSLTELMVALGIAAVLSALALVGFGHAFDAVRHARALAALQDTLLEAQRLAATSLRHVVVCASADGATCSLSTEWEHGWISFIDHDQDRKCGGGEVVLRHQPAWGGTLRVRGTQGRTQIVLQPQGGAAAGSNATLVLCDARGPAQARALVLANSGKITTRAALPAAQAAVCP